MKRRVLTPLLVMLILATSVAVVRANGTGPVSYWPLDGTAFDAINGNDGTIQGGATYVAGKYGQAVQFDGIDDYINIPDSASLDITGDITLSAWIKINEFSTAPNQGYHMYIVSKDTTGQRSYGIGVDLTWQYPGKPFFIAFEAPTSYGIAWGTSPLAKDTWYHISGVFDAATGAVNLYVNGVLQSPASTVGSIYAGTAELRIGARQYPNHQCFFNGVIDEVGIWNRALTADEVAALSVGVGSVEWLPPITLPDWTLNENATLPIKFKLYGPYGNLICTDLSPTLDVNGPLELRFDSTECHYISNFRPTQSGDHTAVVSLNGVTLASQEFVVVEPGKANGRGHGNN